MRGNEKRCVNTFIMKKNILINLCQDLGNEYRLKASKRMSVLEKVRIFLYVLFLGSSNRQAQERFQYSCETISRNFHKVMVALMRFSIDLIKLKDSTFSTIPPEILKDNRYMPHFKVIFYTFSYLLFL